MGAAKICDVIPGLQTVIRPSNIIMQMLNYSLFYSLVFVNIYIHECNIFLIEIKWYTFAFMSDAILLDYQKRQTKLYGFFAGWFKLFCHTKSLWANINYFWNNPSMT